MRFLRLLVLIPALCLGLLGQGHGWVLCQEACGCVALEAAHEAHGHRDACGEHAQACGDEGGDETCACDAGGADEKCHDLALDVGDHVAPKPVQLPDLSLLPVAQLDFAPVPVWGALTAGTHDAWARGPPPQREASLPQVLACVRSVVILV